MPNIHFNGLWACSLAGYALQYWFRVKVNEWNAWSSRFPPISDDSVSFVRTALVVVVLLCTSFSTVAQIRASSLSLKALEEGPVSVIRYVHFVEIRKVVVRGFCRLIMRSYDQTPAVSLRLIPGRWLDDGVLRIELPRTFVNNKTIMSYKECICKRALMLSPTCIASCTIWR